MAGVTSFILIDACVARSAAHPGRHESSILCARLALALADKQAKTGVIMTPALQSEWKKHASRYMTNWLASMEQRRRVRRVSDRPLRDLRNAVSTINDAGVRAAIDKDLHISEVALLEASPVASLDERQRRYLGELAASYELLGKLQWFNPITDTGWENWVGEGCSDIEVYRVSLR